MEMGGTQYALMIIPFVNGIVAHLYPCNVLDTDNNLQHEFKRINLLTPFPPMPQQPQGQHRQCPGERFFYRRLRGLPITSGVGVKEGQFG